MTVYTDLALVICHASCIHMQVAIWCVR